MASSEAHSDGLLAQHRLLLAVIDTDWATRLDHKVAAVIIQRYYPKFGNARASLRFIAEAVRADRSNVIDSTRRLVARGAFSVVREGIGTRPTEYALNFGFAPSGGVGTTASSSDPSGGAATTACGGAATTASDPSGGVGTTESFLHVPAYNAEIHDKKDNGCAAPSAPPGSAAGAPTGPGPAQGKFEEIWAAYDYKKKIKEARAEYERLAPDEELHERIVAAAKEWRQAAGGRSDPDAPRKYLHNWLRDEEYECDPPTAFKPKERKTTKPKSEAAKGNSMIGSPRLWPKGRHMVNIDASEIDGDNGDQFVTFTFQVWDGPLTGQYLTHRICRESRVKSIQKEGKAYLSNLVTACELTSIEDTSELHNYILFANANGKTIKYETASEEELVAAEV